MTIHRPFSALAYSKEEFTTESFMVLVPFVAMGMKRRAAHTARALKALDIYTRLLAIPGTVERHSVFSMSIAAQMATTQISACKNLLQDHAFTIGRDRLRLTIGFLNTMGNFWPLGRNMAKEVKAIARAAFSSVPETIQVDADAEIDFARDDLVWPVDPLAQIDIYAGAELPVDWNVVGSGYNSSSSSLYNTASANTGSTPPTQMPYPTSSSMF